ncbi:MAG: nitrilase-related carbon-nitrogen hydrolase [Coraliomargaritaceae bacterium]
MKLFLAQFAVENGNIDSNLKSIYHFLDQASHAGADLLVLPEMCTTGMDWVRNRELADRSEADLKSLIEYAAKRKIAFCGSFLERVDKQHNANCLYYIDTRGVRVTQYRKTHLFSLFNENDHILRGEDIVTADTGLGTFGFSICYDLRFPELFRQCMLEGAVVQILVAAFPHPRLSHWQNLLRARAIENQVYIVAVNQCGQERHGNTAGEVSYFGHSMVVDPWGEVVFEAGEEPGLFEVELDLELVSRVRETMPALKDRRTDLY